MLKKALILGASSEIGLEVVKKFLSKGWDVVAHCNSNGNELFKIKKKLITNKLIILKFNFEKSSSLKKFFKKIKKHQFGSFINLVGYIDNVSYEKTSLESLIKSIKINSLMPLLIQKNILKNMKSNKFGRLLHVSSIGVKYGGGQNTFNYSLSKHMLEFLPSYIKNLSKYNILSNILRAGVVKTKIHKKIKGKNLKKRIKLIPIGRAANKNEIVNMIFFLSSEKNSYLTNEKVTIAGGE